MQKTITILKTKCYVVYRGMIELYVLPQILALPSRELKVKITLYAKKQAYVF
jgi:hypothetical protein